ncbi:MAG: GNAT family N-acetyltransferase [Pseudomonadota bacterium]
MTFNIHMLDNPFWWSLTTSHREIAEVCGATYALPEVFGPFVACSGAKDGELHDLATLLTDRTTPAIVMARDLPRDLDFPRFTHGVQMVAQNFTSSKDDHCVEELTADDAEEIYALAQRTRPGPFEHRTHELGDFVGIKKDGALIAMAGQRARLPGHTEISAVCVDRAHRGRGYGAAVVKHMAAKICDFGDHPFPHTYADNKAAISLYEKIGFRIRTGVKLLWLDPGALRPLELTDLTHAQAS